MTTHTNIFARTIPWTGEPGENSKEDHHITDNYGKDKQAHLIVVWLRKQGMQQGNESFSIFIETTLGIWSNNKR